MFSDSLHTGRKDRSAVVRFHADVVRTAFLVCRSILLAFTFCTTQIYAQSGILSEKSLSSECDYTIRFWNSENGLPQNSIISCIQTHDGYLWMSTTNGLVRFDGSSFKTFNTKNTQGLSDNYIVCLFEDSRHDLWMITSASKLLVYSHGSFKTPKFQNRKDLSVTAITENNNKEVIVGLINGDICSLNGEKIAVLANAGQEIESMVFVPGRGVYFSGPRGVYLLNNNKIIAIKNLEERRNIKLKKGADETLWAYNGFVLYKIEDSLAGQYGLPAEVETSGSITDILVEEKGKIWVSTAKGIFILNENYRQFLNTQSGLSSNSIRVLLKDDDNNIWAGTTNAGLCKLRRKTIKTFSQEDGLMNDECGPLLNYKDSSILVSNLCKEVSLFENGKFSLFNKEHIGCIWSMLYDNENTVYLGTYGSGLYSLKEGKAHKCFAEDTNAPTVYLALFRDDKNILWAGTKKGLFQIRKDKAVCVQPEEINSTVTYIMQDSKGRIWFCSESGLGVIGTSNEIKIYTTNDGLPHNRVRYVYEDNDGVFWIATYGGGIVRFKNNLFFSFNQAKNIIDDATSCIIEDEQGNLWISSNHGIYCVNKQNANDYADNKTLFLNVKYYGREDGIKNIECNGGFQGAGIKTRSGKIFFPTLGGVAMVDPDRAYSSGNTMPVLVENIILDGVMYFDSMPQVIESPGNLTFNFTSPYFGDFHNLAFQYQLEGYDMGWSDPNAKKTASYLNLPPGNYTFRVRVYGNLAEREFKFSIPSPFWKTRTFYAGVGGLTIIFGFSVAGIRAKNRKRKEEEKIRINKRYAALELKALQSQMNPHFMFNCLNTIKYFIATNDKTAAGKYLSKFSRMIRMFLEYSNANYITLANEINLISHYVEMEQLRLENSFTFNLSVDESIDTEHCEIPVMILQPFIENAIHHGLKSVSKEGVLSVSFIKGNSLLKILIDDNGIGRKNAEALKQVSAAGQKAFGMRLTKERIETINYIKGTTITIEIQDKLSNNEAAGTLIILTIPLKPGL